jgi:penicillin-binding protein 1A
VEEPNSSQKSSPKSFKGSSDEDQETSSVDETSGQPPKKGFSWKKTLYWGAVFGVWTIIAGFFLTLYLAHDLPNVDDLPQPGQNQQVRVMDINSNVLATYGAQYGDWLEFKQIPPIMVKALVAIEDRRYYEHGAIDWRGIARAMVSNVMKGRLAQGGSTITQQLAKNVYLSAERTLKRKVQELFLAMWLEARFSKDEIIAIYLNRVYFGSGAYGLDAASRKYFGHSATSLNMQEAALLAGLFKAPSRYAPTRSPKQSFERMGIVLTAMARDGVITQEAKVWAQENPPKLSAGAKGTNIRYFTDWVLDDLADKVTTGTGPIEVFTTLDPLAQSAAEAALKKALDNAPPELKVSQGAIVSISDDGSVQAMVGGRSFAASQYNRAVQARRQPGSAFKPFVYVAGLRAGLRPTTMMTDKAITIDGWSPKNFNGKFNGRMSVEEALARSINTVAVQVMERAGREQVIELAHDMGIDSPIKNLPSLALGTMEVGLLELTGAYAPFSNGGKRVEPFAILEVRSKSGDLIYRRSQPDQPQVLTTREVRLMRQMLAKVIEPSGSGFRAKLDRPAAGKSGTSQDFRDAWFVGFTSDLIAGVWLGNDDGSVMNRVSGGRLPALTWRDYMMAVHAGRPVRKIGDDRR